MSKEHENLVEAALSLDETLSPRLSNAEKKPDAEAGDVPADATGAPDLRKLTADRPAKTTGKE